MFVHHNTLHAYEDLPFDEGVIAGSRTFGCHPYLPEDRYRAYLEQDRIRQEDLSEVLIDDLGDEADRLIGVLGTRYRLRLGMLQVPLQTGSDAELRWVMAESNAQRRFRSEVTPEKRKQFVSQTRRWVMQQLQDQSDGDRSSESSVLSDLISEFGRPTATGWSDRIWESFVLQFLWRVASNAVELTPQSAMPADSVSHASRGARLRDSSLDVTGQDTDELVHEVLIRVCASFLDQGFAHQ